MPQALRLIIPPLTSQYLNIVKNSSLAVFIGYPDLVLIFAGTVLNQTHAAVQVMAITMGVYLAISLAIAFALNFYNARICAEGALMSGVASPSCARAPSPSCRRRCFRAARSPGRAPTCFPRSARRC